MKRKVGRPPKPITVLLGCEVYRFDSVAEAIRTLEIYACKINDALKSGKPVKHKGKEMRAVYGTGGMEMFMPQDPKQIRMNYLMAGRRCSGCRYFRSGYGKGVGICLAQWVEDEDLGPAENFRTLTINVCHRWEGKYGNK